MRAGKTAMYCERCGERILASARYCESCGSPAPSQNLAPNTLLITQPRLGTQSRRISWLSALTVFTILTAAACVSLWFFRTKSNSSQKLATGTTTNSAGPAPVNSQPDAVSTIGQLLDTVRRRDWPAALEYSSSYQDAVGIIRGENPQVLWEEKIRALRNSCVACLETGQGRSLFGCEDCPNAPVRTLVGLVPPETTIKVLETRSETVGYSGPRTVWFVELSYGNAQTAPLDGGQILRTITLKCAAAQSLTMVSDCSHINQTVWTPAPLRVTSFQVTTSLPLQNALVFVRTMQGSVLGGQPPYKFRLEANGTPLEQVLPVLLYSCQHPYATQSGWSAPPTCAQGSLWIMFNFADWPQNAPWPLLLTLAVTDSSDPPQNSTRLLLIPSANGPVIEDQDRIHRMGH